MMSGCRTTSGVLTPEQFNILKNQQRRVQKLVKLGFQKISTHANGT
jgi:hypothetical protein